MGFTPALPEGIGFVLLAGPDDGPRWGIFACGDQVKLSGQVRPVSPRIEAVLDSGRRYPPALALARDDAGMFPNGSTLGRGEFAERYAARVIHHLSRQPLAPYVLAEALVDEPGYLTRGQYYWVLHYLPGDGAVRWVSEDFQVYQNAASDFRVSATELDALLLPFENAV